MGRQLRTRLDCILPNLQDRMVTLQQNMKQKYDERAQHRTVLPGMHVLVSQVAGLAGVDRSTRWLRGSCVGRSGSKLTVRLTDGRVIQRHLDQVVPDTSCGSRRPGISDGLDDDGITAAAPPVTRPVTPTPSVATDRTLPESIPVSTGSPASTAATPAKKAAPPPELQLSDPVTEVPATDAPSVETEIPPQPRYNLRPRKVFGENI